MIINHSHHDAFFKKFLGDIAIARDFFEIHLPISLRQRCNFNTLSLCSGSFVESNLRNPCSDVLYSVRTTQDKGYIYFLVEHQSSPQKMMAFRLMRYSLAAMQQHLEKGHKELPIVIPMLFYQGNRKRYPYKNDWFACFTDAELAREIYTRPFPVIDIPVMPDEEIITHRRVATLELVQKHIRVKDMVVLLKSLGALINLWPLTPELFTSLLSYIIQAGNTEDIQQFMRKLAQQAPRYQEEIMTIAQQLEQKGKQEGLRQGMKKGKQEATLNIAFQLLVRGGDRILIKEATGLSDEELDRLAS